MGSKEKEQLKNSASLAGGPEGIFCLLKYHWFVSDSGMGKIFSLMDGENHGTAEVGKGLWRMSIPTPLFTAGQLEQAAHDCATF